MRTKILTSLCALSLIACSDDGHSEEHDDGPEITMVAWEHLQPCTNGTANTVTITITAVDPNTPVAELSFSAMVASCAGSVTAATGTVMCPELSPYSGSATVSDDEGHTDTLAFTVPVCQDGMAP